MNENQSFGTLYLVATPIGNLEDISLRALRVFREVRLIAAEDTRRTMTLLSAHGIHAELLSYREENHKQASQRILSLLKQSADVAVVTDAGTPALSDPGFSMVEDALSLGVRVVPIPGPSAVLSALSACGLPASQFHFYGFLPRKAGSLEKFLEELVCLEGTLVFYESPHRIGRTLAAMAKCFGARQAVVARELTKVYETFDRGTLVELAERYSDGAKGELTLVVAGAPEKTDPNPVGLTELLEVLLSGNSLPLGDISRMLAPLTKMGHREIYQLALRVQKKLLPDRTE